MLELTLEREYNQENNHCFGQIEFGNEVICQTIERGWHDNKNGISCIPEGEYMCVPFISPSRGNVYILHSIDSKEVGVINTDRTFIEIHVANKASELEGCIAPGLIRGDLNGEDAVLSSKVAFKKLVALVGWQPFKLTIMGGNYGK